MKSRSAANGSVPAGPASFSRQDRQGAGESLKAPESQMTDMTEPKEGDEINGWPVIFSYTTEQAVEDGVLVYVGKVGRDIDVYFTNGLFAQGYRDLDRRRELVERGLDLLRKPDPEDTPYMHLRVIEGDKIWTIAEPGKITFMMPSDY